MTLSVQPAPADLDRTPWLHALYPMCRVALRWLFIGTLAAFAFRYTLQNLVEVTRTGGMGGYAWTVPVAAVLAATSVARRPRTELPIHDRQTDIIVGVMALVIAVLVHGVLLQRYALYFYLLRLDFLAMWLFLAGAAVVLFGLRPVMRFLWVWILLLMVFPLPYHVAVILLGGTKVSAGAATLLIAAFATAIAVGRTVRRAVIGSTAAWAVGFGVLGVLTVVFPYAPILAYQTIPALTSIVLVGLTLFFQARRGQVKRFLDRKIEPIAASQVWFGLPLVLAAALLLSVVKLPAPPTPPTLRISQMSFKTAPQAPPGWHVTDTDEYPWAQRLYGRGGVVTRQWMTATAGNPHWDKLSRPRTVVVDSVVTIRPMSFKLYPNTMLYNLEDTRLSPPRDVDLGHGVTGQLLSVVDDGMLLSWNALSWTWQNSHDAQQIVVLSVDNHEPGAPFPRPTGGLGATLNTMFAVLFRGNAAVSDKNPVFKDAQMLVEFSRAMVAAKVAGVGP